MTSHWLLEFHVVISLAGIASGLIVFYGLLTGRAFPGWTALFLATTVLTSVSGFPLPPFGLDPPRMIGILSLVLLAIAIAAGYVFHLAEPWRWIYVGTALAALYLNCFVGVVQAFQKLSFLQRSRRPSRSRRLSSHSSCCLRPSSSAVPWPSSGFVPGSRRCRPGQ